MPPCGTGRREVLALLLSLPETARQDSIEAGYKDGVLEIRAPKAEQAKPRQIQIDVH